VQRTNSCGAQPSSPTARPQRRPARLARAVAAGGLVLGALAVVARPAPCPADPPAARLGSPVSLAPAAATAQLPQAAGQGAGKGEPAPLPAQQKLTPEELAPNLTKAPPALPPPVEVYPIDLCTALRLAEADNPTIGISRQAIQEALANQLRANALLLPSLRAGTNFHRHLGVLQSSFGEIRHVESEALYVGGGSRTLAAETVAFPMIQVFSPLADALFEPLVARRLVAVRRNQSAATTNQMLLEVASRFLELVSAEAELGALRATEEDMNQVVQLTAIFAKAGRARAADASRARGEALLLHTQEQRAEERVAVASANLAELLNLDTAIRLQTPAQATGLLQLVDLHADLEALVLQAQSRRPEIAASAAEIARRQAQFRAEQFRPWLPTISVGYSAGTFGGGTNRVDLVPANSNFGRFGSRADFDVIAWWTVQNAGVGNAALQNQRRAQRELATDEQLRLLNLVRREVVAAYGRTEAGRRRVDLARQRLESAEAGFRKDLRRIRGLQGLPIEILNSVERLGQARVALIQSLLEYNRGQFELFVALGQRPTNVCPPNGAAR
jgi:outer membrane protein TolC